MRRTVTIFAAAILAGVAISMTGCWGGDKQASAKAVAPPPVPAVKPVARAPPQPLSTPQTDVQLPPAQPVDPQALAVAPVPEEPAGTSTAPRAPRRTVGPPAIVQQRPEPAAQPATTAPAAATTAPPATEETRPPIGEIVPPNEMKRLQDSADGRKREIKQLLDQARGRGLTRHEQSVISRIESFVKLSDQAEAKGDMREADALAERALVLAKDLTGGH